MKGDSLEEWMKQELVKSTPMKPLHNSYVRKDQGGVQVVESNSLFEGILPEMCNLGACDNEMMCCTSRDKDDTTPKIISKRSQRGDYDRRGYNTEISHPWPSRKLMDEDQLLDFKQLLLELKAADYFTAQGSIDRVDAEIDDLRVELGYRNSGDSPVPRIASSTSPNPSRGYLNNAAWTMNPKPLPGWTEEEQRMLIGALEDDEKTHDSSKHHKQDWEQRAGELSWKIPHKTPDQCMQCVRHIRSSRIAYFGDKYRNDRTSVEKPFGASWEKPSHQAKNPVRTILKGSN